LIPIQFFIFKTNEDDQSAYIMCYRCSETKNDCGGENTNNCEASFYNVKSSHRHFLEVYFRNTFENLRRIPKSYEDPKHRFENEATSYYRAEPSLFFIII